MIEIIPLGTASAIPTRDRHMSSVALNRSGALYLFDCGEGTQMRLTAAGLKHSRIRAIFITHLHGDHFFGLFGLLSTVALLGRTEPLRLVSPAGLRDALAAVPGVSESDRLPFTLDFVELEEGFSHRTVWEATDHWVEARPVEHRIFTVGYRFQEKDRPGHLDVSRARSLGIDDYILFKRLKAGETVTLTDGRTVHPREVLGPVDPGKSFAYVTDTRPSSGGIELARNVDLLYHEATFTHDNLERAVETGHSTAREAAVLARASGARKLLIGHFSARYTMVSPLEEEAREYFEPASAAEELRKYVL